MQDLKVFKDIISEVIFIDSFYIGNIEYSSGAYRDNNKESLLVSINNTECLLVNPNSKESLLVSINNRESLLVNINNKESLLVILHRTIRLRSAYVPPTFRVYSAHVLFVTVTVTVRRGGGDPCHL